MVAGSYWMPLVNNCWEWTKLNLLNLQDTFVCTRTQTCLSIILSEKMVFKTLIWSLQVKDIAALHKRICGAILSAMPDSYMAMVTAG